MPKYTFRCDKCDDIKIESYSISEFVKNKEEKIYCSKCKDGVLFQILGKISNKVDKSSYEIMKDIKDDVRKTVKKIESGDERTIRDIYGETENPHKR